MVVACQAVPFVHPALRRLARRPPLVEHGGLVSEALSGPKDLTDRYVGVCAAIRDAAAGRMPDRPQDALEIPSMVDLAEFDPTDRAAVRREWDVADDVPVVGWVGRLDRKKRVEDVLAAAALLVPRRRPEVRWVVVGGPNFFYPEHEAVLGVVWGCRKATAGCRCHDPEGRRGADQHLGERTPPTPDERRRGSVEGSGVETPEA